MNYLVLIFCLFIHFLSSFIAPSPLFKLHCKSFMSNGQLCCLSVMSADLNNFYPTALKGCQDIVFTHGVRMDGRATGKSLSGVLGVGS